MITNTCPTTESNNNSSCSDFSDSDLSSEESYSEDKGIKTFVRIWKRDGWTGEELEKKKQLWFCDRPDLFEKAREIYLNEE